MRWSVALAVVAAIGASLLASTAQAIRPSAPAVSTAANGGTTFDPNTGTITVNVDLIGAEDANGNEITFKNPDNGQMQTAKQAWQDAVNNLWNGLLKNGGFKKFLFHANCPNGNEAPGYRLHLNLIINPLPPGSAGSAGHHHISLAVIPPTGPEPPGTHDKTTFPNSSLPKGWTPNSDSDSPYVSDDTGVWNTQSPSTEIGHEVGHLIGLGDDDKRNANNQTTGPYDHRSKDTVMYGGHTSNKVNQDLVDRIAKQIQKNYKIPKDCGDYRYDVLIVTSVRNQETLGPNSNGGTYSSDVTFTWKGDFRDVPVEVRRRNGKVVFFLVNRPWSAFSGVLQPVEVRFSASTTDPYVPPPASCSGVLDTLPGYPAPLHFGGSSTQLEQLQTTDALSDEEHLLNLVIAQQQASGCTGGVTAPGLPAFPDIPEFHDADGYLWHVYPVTADMGTDFSFKRNTAKPPKAIGRLFEGKSFSFYSGHFSNTVVTDEGDAGVDHLTESYLTTVSFTRNR